MSCFFSRIKRLFPHDYGGRYLENVLKEVLEEDNVIINDLFNNNIWIRKDSFSVQVEWAIPGKKRFADVAIVKKESNEVIALIEIKYEDQNNLKNRAQLDDYIEYCSDNNLYFTYLTKNMPPKIDLKKVGGSYISYAKLVHRIEKRNNKSHVATMLCEFLREEGYVFQENIDKSALLLLMVNSLSFNNRHGFGKLNTIKRITKDVPKTLETVLNNTHVLGTRFYDHIAYDVFKTRPAVEYRFIPDINIKKIEKRLTSLKKDDEYTAPINDKEIESGQFLSYASFSFPGKGPYMYLLLGYNHELEIRCDDKNPIKSYLFANIVGSKYEGDEVSVTINIQLDEDLTYRKLTAIIKKLLNDLIERKDSSISSSNLSTIRKIYSRLN